MFERGVSSAFCSIGGPVVLPAPTSGTGELPPGGWASRIQFLNWSCAREGKYKKSKLLQLLATMPLLREPVLREGHLWTADTFNEKIGESIAKVEAAYIQCVGRVNDEEGESCLKKEGPFNACIVIDTLGCLKKYANCHWMNKDELCNFYKAPASEPLVVPRTNAPAPVVSPHSQGVGSSAQQRIQYFRQVESALTSLPNAHYRLFVAIYANEQAWVGAQTAMNRVQKWADSGSRIGSADLQCISANVGAGNRQAAAIQTAAGKVTRHEEDLVDAFTKLALLAQD
ncbi:hypothetical protein N7471_004064 [Penicillium samsonianum]|uniref:uncharacterized protein n=1 Tax=Penicillium samsonianum TaxID=1882272 RepID=UPI002546D147|nr:uncharacterized protein N7471_004064 [Penicillium samsonianum]KAJ6137578.1 hypothetical protein N7471_004064 [Penicillium samsonianum]